MESRGHTVAYERPADVGFVTATSDLFAAGIAIIELLEVCVALGGARVNCGSFVPFGVVC